MVIVFNKIVFWIWNLIKKFLYRYFINSIFGDSNFFRNVFGEWKIFIEEELGKKVFLCFFLVFGSNFIGGFEICR